MQYLTESVVTFVKRGYCSHDESHGYEGHALKVLHNVFAIAKMMDDPFTEEEKHVAAITALTHDLRDGKYINRPDFAGIKDENVLLDFLIKELGPKNGARSLHIINTMSWSKRNHVPGHMLNDKIFLLVRDADWIEAIDGPRSLEYNRHLNPKKTELEIYQDVISHCFEKLLIILPELHFPESRLFAEPQQTALEKWHADAMLIPKK